LREFCCGKGGKGVNEMLDDDFLWIDDCCEVDGLIPFNEMSEIAHKLLRMVFSDGQSKFRHGVDREFAQFLFMFHVEQLRESADEVKALWYEQEKTLCLLG
jgi:hypothetical protein